MGRLGAGAASALHLDLAAACSQTHRHVVAGWRASVRVAPWSSVAGWDRLHVIMPTFSVMYKGAVIISRYIFQKYESCSVWWRGLRSTTVRVPAYFRRGGEVVTERCEGRSARLLLSWIIINPFAPRFVLFVERQKEKKKEMHEVNLKARRSNKLAAREEGGAGPHFYESAVMVAEPGAVKVLFSDENAFFSFPKTRSIGGTA